MPVSQPSRAPDGSRVFASELNGLFLVFVERCSHPKSVGFGKQSFLSSPTKTKVHHA